MICPKCDSNMEKVQYEMIEVDRCTHCKGLWFDMLEHESLKVLKGAGVIDIGDPEIGKEYNKIEDIDCPMCKTRMLRMVDKEQPHIWYESCGVCHGVFFDAGEFKDYLEKTVFDFFKGLMAKERK